MLIMVLKNVNQLREKYFPVHVFVIQWLQTSTCEHKSLIRRCEEASVGGNLLIANHFDTF